jgi:recombination protein RecA
MFDEGISHTSLLVDIASEANIIQKSGAWYSYGDQRIGQGRENAKLFLRDNEALMLEIEAKVKDLLGMGSSGTEPVAVAAGEGDDE